MAIQRTSLREQVRDWILQRIGDGELAPGQRLMEEKIATRLSVSPIPVREAIRELVAMEVLESASHRGAWVREVSLIETIEALQVRSVLESLAVQLAGPSIQKQSGKLRQLAMQTARAARKRDAASYQRANQEFHRSIVEAAGSSVLLRVWDLLSYEVNSQLVVRARPDVDPTEFSTEHDGVVAAVKKGDTKAAGKLLSEHALGLARRLQEIAPKPAAEPERVRKGAASRGRSVAAR